MLEDEPEDNPLIVGSIKRKWNYLAHGSILAGRVQYRTERSYSFQCMAI